MKRRLKVTVAALIVCGANAAYSRLSAEPAAAACTISCTSTSQCVDPCNYCFPNPIGGPKCYIISQD